MDTESLLRLLRESGADFVVIGASAFPVYGYSRATLDIDLFIRPEKENARRTLKALGDFGYDVSDVTEEELLAKKLLIRQYVVETDIHPFVAGVTFEQVWEHKVEDFYGDTPVYFASLDDLIEMKRAAGRPRDLEDLKYLEEIRNRTSS
jgi:hypothetical protein